MGLLEILGLVTVALLFVVIVLQVLGHKRSDTDAIISLLKRTAEEQRDGVQKQIANGATEQFERFSVIQKSIQDTLSVNREEVNRQLDGFQRQMETKLADIQKASTESNEQIGRTVTVSLQNSREEQNKQLSKFGDQVEGRLSAVQHANTDSI